jgi:hypothetical protein
MARSRISLPEFGVQKLLLIDLLGYLSVVWGLHLLYFNIL